MDMGGYAEMEGEVERLEPSLSPDILCYLLSPFILELVPLSSFLYSIIEVNRHSWVYFVLLLTF